MNAWALVEQVSPIDQYAKAYCYTKAAQCFGLFDTAIDLIRFHLDSNLQQKLDAQTIFQIAVGATNEI